MSRRGRWAGLILGALGFLLAASAPVAQAQSLEELIAQAAHAGGVHPDLLTSIVWVESQAWPWALNVHGVGLYPRTRAEAEWVLAQVGDDVDIGYAQVSYRYWGRPLGLRKVDLLDSWTNLALGAAILHESMSEEGGWLGVGRYHSATPWRKVNYAVAVARTYQAILRLRANAEKGAAARR